MKYLLEFKKYVKKSKIMKKLPKSFFEEYHKKFKGDTHDICSTCAGCEYSLIASLLPGESDYMAEKMEMNEHNFREKFLDEIMVDNIKVDVIRMNIPYLIQFLFSYYAEKEYSVNFKKKWDKVKKLFEQVNPIFIQAIDKFEGKNYDVVKLEKLRGVSKNEIARLDYNDVLTCSIELGARESTKKFCKSCGFIDKYL